MELAWAFIPYPFRKTVKFMAINWNQVDFAVGRRIGGRATVL
jgi:hypothetical protein